jgi:hypothetical protein
MKSPAGRGISLLSGKALPDTRGFPRPPGESWGAWYYPTETALQAAATVLYCVLPAPYRSLAAFSEAVRAPL